MNKSEVYTLLHSVKLFSPFDHGRIWVDTFDEQPQRGTLLHLWHRGPSNENCLGPLPGESCQIWAGPPFYVPEDADWNAVLKIIMHAFEQYVLHEARELFFFNGKAVFDPHQRRIV